MLGQNKDKYDKAMKDRQRYVDAILNSPEKLKVVVGGPGTGKTYLFQEILKNKRKSLTLTFINALVEDLSLALCGLSDVRTLHGFALNQLAHSNQKIKIFPKLSRVIKEDAFDLLGEHVDYDSIFQNRNDDNNFLPFYKKRKDYYGKYYGFDDIIFALIKDYEKHIDKIPRYDQIVVDEFQDFNRLELSLIDLLAQKSPVLLAGDDDQRYILTRMPTHTIFVRDIRILIRYIHRSFYHIALGLRALS